MRVFLSHISEEAPEAKAIKISIEKALPGAFVFVSAIDIHLGDAWLKEIDQALEQTKVVLALCSPNSVRRPWLNFESGSGWSRHLPIIPICFNGMHKENLPDPMRIFQAIELTSKEACTELINRLASVLQIQSANNFDPKEMLLEHRVERPPRGSDIGIVLCHQQQKWEDEEKSVFTLAQSLPAGLEGSWNFRPLEDERIFLSSDLHKMSGLILATPWRARVGPEAIAATVEWVRAGGRLLLLGFELGDRHHAANLAELSHHFGIDPSIDIVAPPRYGPTKPYNEPIDFSPMSGDEHPFTTGLTNIRLSNVQTVRVDPGGTEWLCVGQNLSYRPLRKSVRYRDGTMTAPGGATFEIADNVGRLPVAVEAPQGLCAAGSVHMIGTWDLIGRKESFGYDNLTLLSRMLNWLARKAI